MNKLNKNEEIAKLQNALMEKINSENDVRYNNLSVDEVMKIIVDSGSKGKYVFWIIREYLKGNIQRFEDMGRVKQALILFKNNLSKFTEQQKQLNKMSFQELEALVSPYQDVLTQNEIKRMNKEKIWSEIDVIYNGPEGRIYVPKTKEASIFLGQGTKWCTASLSNNNIFDYYNNKGPLYVFVLPEKDEKGRELKYQLHFETNQFMNAEDCGESIFMFNKKTKMIDILMNTLGNERVLKHFLAENMEPVFERIFIEYFKNIFNDDILEKFFLTKLEINHCYKIWIYSNKSTEILQEIIEFVVEKNCDYLCALPARMITEKMVISCVSKKGEFLKYVPEKMKTIEICEIAFKNSLYAHYYIPSEFKKYDFYKKCITENPHIISLVPDNIITYKLCELAVEKQPNVIEFIGGDFIDRKLIIKAVKNGLRDLYLFNEKFKTKHVLNLALNKSGSALQYFPNKLVTPELCELAVRQDGRALSYVPAELRTPELCEIAVRQNGYALIYVAEALKTYDLCNIAVAKNGIALNFVPDEFKTYELCKLAVSDKKCNIGYGPDLSRVPLEMRTYELCEIAINCNGSSLLHIPKEHHTIELYKTAIKNDIKNIEFLRDCSYEVKKHLEEYVVEVFCTKHNLSYSLDQIVKMLFELKENDANKNDDIDEMREFFKEKYLDIQIKKIEEINNNEPIEFKKY